MKDNMDFVMNRCVSGFLMECEGRDISETHKLVDMTYSHAVRISHQLKKLGFLSTKMSGRSCIITLTDKGREVSYLLKELLKAIGGD
jgi:DNA-binding MarR family transcriptional regulator